MIADQVAVISLPARQDRRDRLAERWPYPSLPLTFRDAVDDPTDPTGACLASHLQVLAAGGGPLLVLEDDAVFADGFTLDLDPPADWRLLWLGRQPLGPLLPVNAVWAQATRIARTHAYVARDPGMLAGMLAGARRPRSIDPALSELRVPQYVLRVATVGQGAGLSNITGTARKQDQFWNHKGDM